MLVEELKNYSSLPEEFLDLLPEYCVEDGCDYPMGITETLTSLYCTNPRCPSKIAIRLTTLCKDLNIKGIGEAMARKFIETYGITSPLQIFMYALEDGTFTYDTSRDVSIKLYNQIQDNKEFTLVEYIQAAQLPNIQATASKIFEGYATLSDAYRDIEEGGLDFIKRKLNIGQSSKQIPDLVALSDMFYDSIVVEQDLSKVNELAKMLVVSDVIQLLDAIKQNDKMYIRKLLEEAYLNTENTVSTRAMNVYESLLTYKEDFFECLDYVDIRDTSELENVNVVISTSVGAPYGNKKDFVTYINKVYGNFVHINYRKTVTKDTHFLIWSGVGAATTKVTQVLDINDRREDEETHIRILTGQEFDTLCREEFLHKESSE